MIDEVEAACAYDELQVPALTQVWAPRVLEAAGVKSGHRVLDVACGTGILARAAAGIVGPTGKVVGIDSDAGMITVARRRARSLEWKVGRAGSLPEEDQSFDAVVSQFGLMFVSDPKEALTEMHRVLAPGGRLAVAVWDSLEKQTGFATEVELLRQIAGPKAARALRAPFYLGNGGELRSLVKSAGFTDCSLSVEKGVARFPSIRAMVESNLRVWLPQMRVHLVEEQIERILDEAELDFRPYVQSNGELVFEVSVHLITAPKLPE